MYFLGLTMELRLGKSVSCNCIGIPGKDILYHKRQILYLITLATQHDFVTDSLQANPEEYDVPNIPGPEYGLPCCDIRERIGKFH
jgi:hypothetical protein